MAGASKARDGTGEAGLHNPGFIPEEEEYESGGGAFSSAHNNNGKGIKREEFDIAESGVRDGEDEHRCRLFCGLVPLPCCGCRTFLTAKWVLVFLCWASTVQGMVINGFVNVVITTLERRFGLQSTTTGLVAGVYDVGSMLSVIPISYFGGRLGTSKPRYISMGLVLMGTGSLLFSFPHFLAGEYLTDKLRAALSSDSSMSADAGLLCSSQDAEQQNSGSDGGECSVDQEASKLVSSLSSYRWFFFAGQFLHGVGAAPLITLGTTLLDESVSKRDSPLYIGIFQTMFVVGPALGFILGGVFLSFYTDVGVEPPSALGADHPLWVGAWWVGFVLAWIAAWACAFFIGMYPKTLPGADKHNQVSKTDGFSKLAELPGAIWALLTNPTYMFINLGGAMDGFSVSGLSTFLPKFLQYQYGLTSSVAALAVGAMAVPAGGCGTFLGGYVTKRFKLSRDSVIKMYMWCQLVTVPAALGFLFTCGGLPFNGVNKHYHSAGLAAPVPDSSSWAFPNLTATCNSECACDLGHYSPVCGSDGEIYFSPCHAGCTAAEDGTAAEDDGGGGALNYTSCGCVSDPSSSSSSSWALGQSCPVSCSYLVPFLACVFVTIFFTFVSSMPNVVATLRSVEPVHRSLALGIESICIRILGTIPGPVLFGYLIDQSCLLWQQQGITHDDGRDCKDAPSSHDPDHKEGSCLFYDNKSMSIYLLATVFVVKALAVISFAVTLYFSKRSHIRGDYFDDDGDGEEREKK